jgi:hypothetical protein
MSALTPRPCRPTTLGGASVTRAPRAWIEKRARCWETVCKAGSDEQDLDQLLQEDLRRLQSRREQDLRSVRSDQGSTDADEPSSSLKELVDKALIADFFFILFALGWLGAGVGLKSATGVTGLLDAWLALWQWVFQPAIGVLMLGALVSGGIGWLRENEGKNEGKKR